MCLFLARAHASQQKRHDDRVSAMASAQKVNNDMTKRGLEWECCASPSVAQMMSTEE